MSRSLSRLAVGLSCLLLASACTSTLRPAELGANGRFQTSTVVEPQNNTVSGPFVPDRHRRMAVVLNFTEDERVKDFYYRSISNSNVFERVFSEAELEQYILQNGIDNVTDTSSLISLRNLSRSVGPFLVIRPYFEWQGGYDYRASLEVIDAETSQTLYRAEKRAFNFSGLDGPLFYPLFNAFLDWTQGRSPQTAAGQGAVSS
jgi:hypothetical protein